MSTHALIIDDDPAIRETLSDRLESLGHTFDQATSQEEGEELLRDKRFDYVLLDLELPLRRGRPASLEAGKNLLRDAIANPLIQRVGFIVVTAFSHDTPDLAVEVIKIGAVDFVRKPYHGLENAIRDCLKRRQIPQPPLATGHPREFTGGELVFLSDRVELNGVEICGDGGDGIMRGILEQLAHRADDCEFVRLPAKILAERFGEDKTHSVAVAIKRFRKRVTRLMKAGGVQIGLEDVIVTRQGGAGYQRAPSLTVRTEVAVAAPTSGAAKGSHRRGPAEVVRGPTAKRKAAPPHRPRRRVRHFPRDRETRPHRIATMGVVRPNRRRIPAAQNRPATMTRTLGQLGAIAKTHTANTHLQFFREGT